MNAEILGVSFEPPEKNHVFAESESFPYRLLSDTSKQVGKAYGVAFPDDHQYTDYSKRYSFLINPEGFIHKIYSVKDILGHPDQVLYDLEEAQKNI